MKSSRSTTVRSASLMSGSDFPSVSITACLLAGEASMGVTSTNNLPAEHRRRSTGAVAEDETMSREIDALNEEMEAAGVRKYVAGLSPATSARSLLTKDRRSNYWFCSPQD